MWQHRVLETPEINLCVKKKKKKSFAGDNFVLDSIPISSEHKWMKSVQKLLAKITYANKKKGLQ